MIAKISTPLFLHVTQLVTGHAEELPGGQKKEIKKTRKQSLKDAAVNIFNECFFMAFENQGKHARLKKKRTI